MLIIAGGRVFVGTERKITVAGFIRRASQFCAKVAAGNDRNAALRWAEIGSAVGTVILAAEYTTRKRDTVSGGFNDWSLIRESFKNRYPSPVMRVLDVVGRPRVAVALSALRVGAGVLTLAPQLPQPVRGASSVAAGLLTATQSYLRHNGGDGSDQLGVMLPALTGLARLSKTPQTRDNFLWAIALQGTMNYFIAGVVKIAGRAWRNGGAVEGVMRTRSFGHQGAFHLVRKYPEAARAVERATLALETFFPLAYVLTPRLREVFLSGAMALHVGIGVVMGLGRFIPGFWAFQGPLRYTMARRTELAGPPRHDGLPWIVAGLGTLVALKSVGHIAQMRRVFQQRRESEDVLVLDRHEIAVRGDSGSDDKPFVLVHTGLMAPKEMYYAFAEAVPEGWGWAVFDRPGYGVSRRTSGYGLATVEELREIVSGVVRHFDAVDRPLWTVGHSMGGQLAMNSEIHGGQNWQGELLLDPSVVGMTTWSEIQAETSATLLESLQLNKLTLRLGLGWIMRKSESTLPISDADRNWVVDMLKTPDMWSAAEDEWRHFTSLVWHTTEASLESESNHPRIVLTASSTSTGDPRLLEAHQQLPTDHGYSQHRIVEDTTHDSLVLSLRAIETSAELLDRLHRNLEAEARASVASS